MLGLEQDFKLVETGIKPTKPSKLAKLSESATVKMAFDSIVGRCQEFEMGTSG